jgi:hypothetical protein
MVRGNALFSFGGASWRSARIWQKTNPGCPLRLVFTDVLYEDADTYRFGLQAAANVFGRKADWVPAAEDFPDYRVAEDVPIEEYAGNPLWRAFLRQLRLRAQEEIPELVWLSAGRDPWEIFRDQRYLGNSRRDPCSKLGKRMVLDKWLAIAADPEIDILIYGIGEHEKHRFEDTDKDGNLTGIRPRLEAKGWIAEAPLIGLPEINPTWHMHQEGLRPARNYALGYLHDNCGGFCIKAGKAHYQNRRRVHAERYAYDAMMERKFVAWLGKPVTILTEVVGRKKRQLSLADFGTRMEAEPEITYDYEQGESGCGCMLDEAA